MTKPTPETKSATTTSRVGENGSSVLRATPAVTMKPTIIISQAMVAAAGRRVGSVRAARSTSNAVPAALTPTPISEKASVASARPASTLRVISPVATAASTPPAASTAMPPMMNGVRRPPRSEPCPRRGRSTWIQYWSAISRPGRTAGRDSSTFITRFSVEVDSTKIAPSAVCTSPSRAMPNQDSGAGSCPSSQRISCLPRRRPRRDRNGAA